MGKLFELGFAGIYNVFFWKSVILKRKNRSGRLFPTKRRLFATGDFTRPTFLVHYFPLGQEHIPVEAHPTPNSNMFMLEQTLAIATSRCATAEDSNMK
jgi:hypothetical protein